MKKLLFITISLLIFAISAYAARQITLADSKLIYIAIRPIYTSTAVTFEIEVSADIYNEQGEYSHRVHYKELRSDLTAGMRAQLDNFIKKVYRDLRNSEINEDNDNLPTIE